MTEAEWLASDDPQRMLEFLQRGIIKSVMNRKLRRFVEACRKMEGRVYTDRDLNLKKPNQLRIALEYWETDLPIPISRRVTKEWRSSVLRDIFGNPFVVIETLHRGRGGVVDKCWSRPRNPKPGERLITFDEGWLSWNGGTVPRLAQQMYDSNDFSTMGILADALEEAGCDNQDMLMHCRGYQRCHRCVTQGEPCDLCQITPPVGWYPSDSENTKKPHGPHVRGCWVLDCILGKC